MVLGLLSQKGLVSSQELQDATVKSQATVTRLLDELSDRVLVFGKARATRYGFPKSIHGHGAQHPIWWTDVEGRVQHIGSLSLLTGNTLCVETDHVQAVTNGALPWFLAIIDSLDDQAARHVLVKFSPPRGTPCGERWHDLLHAEALASETLADHGVTVAKSFIVESKARTCLVGERFDRIGEHGRRHVVSVGDAHKAFVADSYSNWAATCAALARQRRLSELDAQRAAALLAFGRLTGNSDMHSGNLGLFVELATEPGAWRGTGLRAFRGRYARREHRSRASGA